MFTLCILLDICFFLSISPQQTLIYPKTQLTLHVILLFCQGGSTCQSPFSTNRPRIVNVHRSNSYIDSTAETTKAEENSDSTSSATKKENIYKNKRLDMFFGGKLQYSLSMNPLSMNPVYFLTRVMYIYVYILP